jgi:hypothetical protein
MNRDAFAFRQGRANEEKLCVAHALLVGDCIQWDVTWGASGCHTLWGIAAVAVLSG